MAFALASNARAYAGVRWPSRSRIEEGPTTFSLGEADPDGVLAKLEGT